MQSARDSQAGVLCVLALLEWPCGRSFQRFAGASGRAWLQKACMAAERRTQLSEGARACDATPFCHAMPAMPAGAHQW